MDKLEALNAITKISNNVVRVLGQNPGKFTLQGTNTYIIGSKNPYTLVDTGEGCPEYIPILESALRETTSLSDSTQPYISDIVISHWHHDHVGGIPAVLDLLRRLGDEGNNLVPFKPPRLHKFPIPSHAALHSHSHVTLPSIINSLSPGSYTPTADGNPFHDLSDGQTLNGLRILHTPGHTVDSICLYLSSDRALYTADTVLGVGTAVFDDLSAYMESLQKMLRFGREVEGQSFDILYPGHGPVVQYGPELIETYIRHRLEREGQIVAALRSPADANSVDGGKNWTTWSLVSKIYTSYPENLWLPASHGVNLHLLKLETDGVVTKLGGEGVHTSWKYTNAGVDSAL